MFSANANEFLDLGFGVWLPTFRFRFLDLGFGFLDFGFAFSFFGIGP